MKAFVRRVWAAALTTAIYMAASSGASAASPYSLSYNGRITDAQGKPLSGETTVRVQFFRASSGGAALPVTFADTDVALNAGIFQLDIALSAADFHLVFNGVDPVWIQVSDVTNDKTYPRQSFSAVPYALKVPVDPSTLGYNADGQLTLSAAPEDGKFLSSSGGALQWMTLGGGGDMAAATYDGAGGSASGVVDNAEKLGGQAPGFYTNAANITTGVLADAQIPALIARDSEISSASRASVSGTAPVDYNSGTGAFSMQPASGSVNGFLSSGDWTTFSGKQAAITAASNVTLNNLIAKGDLKLDDDDASAGVTIKAKDATTASYTLTLPDDDGTNGQLLRTDGNGALSWITPGGDGDMYIATYDLGGNGVVNDSEKLNGQAASYYNDAANLTGTIADARIPAGIARDAELPAVDATSVNAAGAVMNSDFGSNGIMSRTGAGTYGVVTDNSANWNTAYGWGSHAAANYIADADFSANGLMTRTAAGVYGSITDSSGNWNTAYSDRLKWDGGSTDLVPATGRTSLGLGSIATQSAASVAITGGTLTGVTLTTPTFANDAISGDKVDGGTISNFASTGIDDNADALAMTIDSSERVGIGTNSPSAQLHIVSTTSGSATIEGGSGNARLHFRNTATGSTGTDGSLVGVTSTVNTQIWNYENGFMQFATNDLERMRIDPAGNVGIGSSGPGTRLQVNTAANSTPDGIAVLSPQSHSVSIYPDLAAGSTNSLVQVGDSGLIFSGGAIDTGNLVIAPWANSAAGLRMTNSGNIGVGTASPFTLLHAAKDVTDTDVTNGMGQLVVGGVTNANKHLIVGYNTSSNYGYLQGNTFGATWDTVSLQPKGGNVGVGTTAPDAKLHVNGDIKLGNSGAACNATTEGSQRYNGTLKKMELCNGTNWNAIEGDKFLLQTVTASNSASVAFTDIDGTYSSYEILILDAIPATDATALFLRVSTDNGATWKAGASDYSWANIYTDYNVGPGRNSDAADTEIAIADESANQRVGNAAGEGFHGTLLLFKPSSTVVKKIIRYRTDYINEAGQPAFVDGQGFYAATTAINAVRFHFSAGNISQGTFKLYGLR